MVTVCVLCYGDYPELAQRCLEPLFQAPPGFIHELRIGLNAVSERTAEYVHTRARMPSAMGVRVYTPSHNVGKYPLMRRMFYGDPPLDWAHKVMWFDDDSYLDPTCDQRWWQGVSGEARQATVLGRLHMIRPRGAQLAGIAQQPWYRGLDCSPQHRFRFVTGAWWVAHPTFLRRWDYPFPEIHHNGGDSILGELVRQQGGFLDNSLFAKCHCESCLRRPQPDAGKVHVNVGGRAGRRGLGLHKEVYPWQNYPDCGTLDIHQFLCQIAHYAPCPSVPNSTGST